MTHELIIFDDMPLFECIAVLHCAIIIEDQCIFYVTALVFIATRRRECCSLHGRFDSIDRKINGDHLVNLNHTVLFDMVVRKFKVALAYVVSLRV